MIVRHAYIFLVKLEQNIENNIKLTDRSGIKIAINCTLMSKNCQSRYHVADWVDIIQYSNLIQYSNFKSINSMKLRFKPPYIFKLKCIHTLARRFGVLLVLVRKLKAKLVPSAQWARTVGQAILGIFLGIGHTECHFIGLTCVKFTF